MPPSRSPRLLPDIALGALAALTLCGLAALATGCAKKPLPVVQVDPSEVEYAGCYEVESTGPVCLLDKKTEGRTLSLHPLRKANQFELRVDGKAIPTNPVEGPAGPILRMTVPANTSNLEVRVFTQGAIRVWTLRIANWPTAPGWLSEAWNLYNKGGESRIAARALLDHEIDRCPNAKVRAVALGFLASLEAAEGDRHLRTLAFRRAIAAHRAVGYVQGEVFLANNLVFELIQAHDFSTARGVLQEISLPPGSPVEAHRRLIHLRGLLARDLGDFRTAIGEFEVEADLAGNLGLDQHRAEALQAKALTLIQLGQYKDADGLSRELTSSPAADANRCSRANNLTNSGWARYLARESGDWNLGDPIEPYSEARAIYRAEKSCPNQAREELNSTINLALAFLQSDRTEEAEGIIADAAPAAARATPLVRMWWLDLRARLALKQRQAGDALGLYGRLEREARATLSPENEWRAAFGKARALLALDHPREAADALANAEELVDLQLTRVPLGAGRESFSDQWSTGSRLYVETLLRSGQPEKALLVARRARGRVLNQLAESARVETLSPEGRKERDASLSLYWKQRNDLDHLLNETWQEPKARQRELQVDLQRRLRETQQALDQVLSTLGGTLPSVQGQRLRRPQAGEVQLTYFPLSSGRKWAAFCDDGASISVEEFVMPGGTLRSRESEKSLARVLLEPFKSKIVAGQRLVVLPYGLLKAVDFQALPFGGGEKVLVDDRPVIYGLDIPDHTTGPTPARASALVVSDSRADLPEARQEGSETQAWLTGLRPPWSVNLLQGKRATAQNVRRAIEEGVDLFHYAGHADFSGRGGWESQIPLAEQTRLTLGDILTFKRQPRWVVLSGCETGASDDSAQVESQGLAHAFLLGGSEAVVAASRKVNDKVARELVLEMYRHLGSTPDLATLLQRAQKTLKSRGVSQREWASFRVFEP